MKYQIEADSAILQNTLDNIDVRLSWIEGQLADADVTIVKKD